MEFVVHGKPQGKARPRFSRKSGTVYTPKKTASYEKDIAKAYLNVNGLLYPDDVYIRIQVKAVFPVPTSWSKTKKLGAYEGIIRPAVKPDGDNILKVVMDALNGIAYVDDKQVVYCSCQKVYGNTAGFLEIGITEDKV